MTHSIFTAYSCDLTTSQNNAEILKNHPQIPAIIDALSRKTKHHVFLSDITSKITQNALLASIASTLSENHAPKSLREINFIYFDVKKFLTSNESLAKIKEDFFIFCEELKTTNRRVIFAIDDLNNEVGDLLQTVLNNDTWRLIIFSEPFDAEDFTHIKISAATKTQSIALLAAFKNELETYHNVIIPEETFVSAYAMTNLYLPHHDILDTALELLDSAAARASTNEHSEHKAIVSSMTLAMIVSNWTQIPLSHLHNNTFQIGKFVEALQRRLFGQDAALTAIASTLQRACLKIHEKSGPLCSFLFVGSASTGKSTTAYDMTEHLFGHKHAMLRVNLHQNIKSLADVKIICEERHNPRLLDAIRLTPYALVLIENIDETSVGTLNLFNDILSQGVAFDDAGNKYDFSHAIFIVTTTLGAERIAALTQAPATQENNKTLDLLQLVLNSHPQDQSNTITTNLTAQEFNEELLPTLANYFSSSLLQHLQVVPFLPLDYSAFEKIIRAKMKNFAKSLEVNFDIELNYAAEVIKFLAHEALWQKPNKSLEKLLEQHIYSVVANEIIAHADDKNRPKRLHLQLNDHGQILRCEFVSSMGTPAYLDMTLR